MKRLFFTLLVFIVFSEICFASWVKVVTSAECNGISARVRVPIAGFKNREFASNVVDLKSNVLTNIPVDSAGIFRFQIMGANVDLLLFPTDTVTLLVSKAEGNKLDINVDGANAPGHKVWLEMHSPYVKKFLAIRERIQCSSDVDSIYNIYTGYVDSLCSSFTHLEQQKSITPEFCTAITSFLKADMGVFLMEFFDVQWEMKVSLRDSLYSRYMKYLDYTNPKFSSIKEDAIDWFYCFKYGKPNLDEPTLLGVYAYQATLPRQHQEYHMASTIAFAATHGSSDEIDWKRCHKYFVSKFPNSVFLEPLNKTLEPYYAIKEEDVKRDVIVLKPTTPYPTLSALVADKYKGKVVFVDFWASWCGPCRSEFIYSKELHALLAKYNVEMLYISIDEKEAAWLNALKSGILVGSHYRANEQLYADIDKTFFPESSLSIPLYALIGTNGEILSFNMPRPSSMEKLEVEIKRLINENNAKLKSQL